MTYSSFNNPYVNQPSRTYDGLNAPDWAGNLTTAQSEEEVIADLVKSVQNRISQAGILTASELAAATPQAEAKVQQVATELIEQHNQSAPGRGLPLLTTERSVLLARIVDDVLGWGPLAEYMRDPQVEEITLNGHDRGFVIYAGGRKAALHRGFVSGDTAREFFNRKIEAGHGYRVTAKDPYRDAQLPDGSRLNIVIPPLTQLSISVTVRRFRPVARDLAQLVQLGTLTPALQNFLTAVMRSYQTTVVAGGTGTGKTTFLQACSSVFPPEDRVVSIEDTPELQLGHLTDWVPILVRHEAEGVTEIGMDVLVRNALRMRPVRILLGEARGGEMVDILTACNTGHDGTMFTVHANSTREAVERMVTMYRMGSNLAPEEVRKEILMAVRFIVHLKRVEATGKRYIAGIGEITRLEGPNLVVEEIFSSQGEGEPARFTGTYPKCRPLLESRGSGFDFGRDVVELDGFKAGYR